MGISHNDQNSLGFQSTSQSVPQSPNDEMQVSVPLTSLDSDLGVPLLNEKLMQPPEEPPYFLEKW